MARPAGTDDFVRRSVAHFFSHLADAHALRSNPIAAQFFRSLPKDAKSDDLAARLVAIRERILRACEIRRKRDLASQAARAERHYAIVVRCDLLAEPRKRVAQELGISLRHFSREQWTAREHVVRLLTEEATQPPLHVVEVYRAAIAHGMMLAELGRDADAVREFRANAANAASAQERILALTALAAVERDWARLDSARAALDSAAFECHNILASDTERLVATSMVTLARTELAIERGEFDSARRGLAGLSAMLPHLLASDASGAVDAATQILRAQTLNALLCGSMNETLEYATRGLEVLSLTALPPTVRTDFLYAQIWALHDTGLIDQVTAQSRLTELLRSSQSSGCLRQSAVLFSALGEIGPPEGGHSYYFEAVRIAQAHGAHSLQRDIRLTKSCAAVLLGDWPQVAAELRHSRLYGAGRSDQRLVADDIQSRLLVAQGQPEAAFSILSSACTTAKAIGNERVRGALLRSMAAIRFKSGDLSEARELIESSLPLVEHHGCQLSLQLSLDMYHRLADGNIAGNGVRRA
jgi:hypothetical protein